MPTAPQGNILFRPTKTRRLVSAWMTEDAQEHAIERITEFQDIFDQTIFMCGLPSGLRGKHEPWPPESRKQLNKRLRDLGVCTLNDYGGGWKDCGELLQRDPKLADQWVERMLAESDAVGTDGVDIDFEGWPGHSRYVYTDFIHRLGAALHARGKMLSICVYSLSPEARRENTIGFTDIAVLAQWVDHFRPMTYDLYSPPSDFPGPTSIAPWGRETMTYMCTHIPRHKIVMGLPTYSVDWDMTESSRSTQVYDYQWIAQREKESPIGRGWCYYWDVNLIRYTDSEGHPHLLYLSDAKSTKSHLVTVDSLDLAGVSFWVLNGDDPKIWHCVREHFKRW